MEEITIEKIAKKLSECPRDNSISLPAIFGINNKEVYITQWISYFLDPKLTNGWYGMLNALLSFYYMEVHNDKAFKDTVSNDDNVTVYPEYIFNDGRRIDILVSTSKYLIAIENKLWSDEQFNQTKDYRNSLEQLLKEKNHKGKNLVCLYLKPEYNKSNADETSFKNISYGQLYEVLESIELPSDERTRWLLKEFKDYIKKEDLMKSYPVCSERAEKYKEFIDTIEPARDEYERYLNSIDSWLKNNEELNKYYDISGLHPGYWQIIKDQRWRKLDFHIEVFPLEKNEYIQRFGFADQLEIVIHLEPKNPEDSSIIDRFKKYNKQITKSKNNTYTLISKRIERNFSNEKEANKTIDELLKVIEGEEFNEYYKIADEIIEASKD